MEKAVIYCRVSSHSQVDGASLSNQKEACLKHADKNNMEVEEIYVEEGESATAADRTEFLKALDRCKKDDSIDAFIVWKVDRFARNTRDHFGVRAKLKKHGTDLHSVSEPIKDTPQGKLMETMLAGFAEFENDIRKERTTSGMRSQLKDGLWIWQPPFGYIKPEKESKRVTEPPYKDKKRAPFIRRGAKRYAKGDITMKELAEVSTEWGLRTKTGKPMRKQLWDRIFKNKFYTGVIVSPFSDEIYEGKHKAIIPQQLYSKVQKVKKARSNNKTGHHQIKHPDFPLRGFVQCAQCNDELTASWSTSQSGKYPYYRCKNSNCSYYSKSIKKAKIEGRFVDFLNQIGAKSKYVRLFKEVVKDVWKQRQNIAGDEKKSETARLDNLQQRKNRLIDMRADGDIGKNKFKEEKHEIEQEIEEIKEAQDEAIVDKKTLDDVLKHAERLIKNAGNVWSQAPPRLKRQIQQIVPKEGIAYDKKSNNFGTPVLGPVFAFFEENSDDSSENVAGAGISHIH